MIDRMPQHVDFRLFIHLGTTMCDFGDDLLSESDQVIHLQESDASTDAKVLDTMDTLGSSGDDFPTHVIEMVPL